MKNMHNKLLYGNMKNRLSIKREYWLDVTDVPHFIVDIEYEGCNVSHEDIYFDDIDKAVFLLQTLERERQGTVTLDGGFRFIFTIESTSTGGLQINFTTESSGAFPGRLKLEGYFQIGGEYTASVLNSLIEVLRSGKEFII